MNKLVMCAAAVAMAASVQAGVAKDAMTNVVNVVMNGVETHNRYPWNGKVDIDFSFSCEEPTAFCFVHFKAEYKDEKGATVSVPMKTFEMNGEELVYPWATTGGAYRVTWNSTADVPNLVVTNIRYTVEANMAKYMIVNLASNTISYREECPDPTRNDHGWTYADKTTNIVFRLIQPGKFMIGQSWDVCKQSDTPPGEITITRPFYFAVFETTRYQFSEVFGTGWDGAMSWTSSLILPANRLSWTILRASNGTKDKSGLYNTDASYAWPLKGSEVTPQSLIGKLRARLGNDVGFDIPTDAEWQYVARCGSFDKRSFCNGGMARNGSADGNADAWGYDNKSLNPIACYKRDASMGDSTGPVEVGSYLPSDWGIFDLHGNVAEFVLDRYTGRNARSESQFVDPYCLRDDLKTSSGALATAYILKGGSYRDQAYACAAEWEQSKLSSGYIDKGYPGCRLVWRFPTKPVVLPE